MNTLHQILKGAVLGVIFLGTLIALGAALGTIAFFALKTLRWWL